MRKGKAYGLLPLLGIMFMLASMLMVLGGSEEETIVIQPCLSNNISIMRNNDHSSMEQPLVVSSECRTDGRQPSDERGLLKFDLSEIPKGWRVKEARLELYVIGTYIWDEGREEWQPTPSLTRLIYVNRLIKDWKGWSFTYWSYANFPDSSWDNPGGDFNPSNAKVNFEHPGSWNLWMVTEDVREWYELEGPNYGWLLKDAEEGSKIGYRVEYMNWFYVWDVKYSPKLVVHLVKDGWWMFGQFGLNVDGLRFVPYMCCVEPFRVITPIRERVN
ncbi:MAG: DNRLRE domain-containing protein [Candidatus Bathyarchaeia archaeon]